MNREQIIMTLIAMEQEKDVLKERFEKAKVELRDLPDEQLKVYKEIAMALVPLTIKMLELSERLENMDRGLPSDNGDLILPE